LDGTEDAGVLDGTDDDGDFVGTDTLGACEGERDGDLEGLDEVGDAVGDEVHMTAGQKQRTPLIESHVMATGEFHELVVDVVENVSPKMLVEDVQYFQSPALMQRLDDMVPLDETPVQMYDEVEKSLSRLSGAYRLPFHKLVHVFATVTSCPVGE